MSIKSDERRMARERLNGLSKEYIEQASSLICEKLFKTSYFSDAKVVFVYLSFQKEVETQRIIETALKMGKKIAIPRISNGEMLSIDIETVTNFSYNIYGIKEPIDGDIVVPDLIVMPMLAFDSNRTRLGRGKGYYDRYMQKVNTKSVALAFSCQKVERLCTDEWDFSPDMIITEEETIE